MAWDSSRWSWAATGAWRGQKYKSNQTLAKNKSFLFFFFFFFLRGFNDSLPSKKKKGLFGPPSASVNKSEWKWKSQQTTDIFISLSILCELPSPVHRFRFIARKLALSDELEPFLLPFVGLISTRHTVWEGFSAAVVINSWTSLILLATMKSVCGGWRGWSPDFNVPVLKIWLQSS